MSNGESALVACPKAEIRWTRMPAHGWRRRHPPSKHQPEWKASPGAYCGRVQSVMTCDITRRKRNHLGSVARSPGAVSLNTDAPAGSPALRTVRTSVDLKRRFFLAL